MKVDLNLEPKDFLKLAFFVGTAASVMYGKGEDGTKIAVLETKMEAMAKDVTEIKTLLLRRSR
jgi:hypothetical protein